MYIKKDTWLIFLFKNVVLITTIILISSCRRDSNPIDHQTTQSNVRSDCDFCKILFIGSSYLSIAGNDVVEIFDQFTEQAGKLVYIDAIVISGHRLKDHSENPLTLEKIRSKAWDYIILQGNSAYLSQEKWHDLIVPYIESLRKDIKKNSEQTCVIYMMPWAYEDGLTFLPGETDDYSRMQINLYNESIKLAKKLDIAVAPAGWTWYNVISDGYEKKLYLNDYNHQSLYGAYLTACVFYSTVFLERAPVINFAWELDDDPEYFQNMAHSVVMDSLELWNIY